MTITLQNIQRQVEEFVVQLLMEKIPQSLSFHNIDHTREVVNATKLIGDNTALAAREMFIAITAAWFHDTGFTEVYHHHEAASVKIASDFLHNLEIDEPEINEVLHCIEATRIPQYPRTEAACVLCDADLFHFSQPYFFDRTLVVRNEWKQVQNRPINKLNYLEETLLFFELHQYQTEYGRTILAEGKKQNEQLLRERIEKERKEEERKTIKYNEKIDKLERRIVDLGASGRGIETMFRITARNQINLSAIADNKANIMISINAILLSVIVTTLTTQITINPHLIIPFIIQISVSLITMVLAILATRPNMNTGKFTREEIEQNKVNLLFFGNFFKNDVEDYVWGIREMMKNYDNLYDSLIRDQFFLGRVLGLKYRLLRITYTVFMFGLIISVMSFAIAIIFNTK